MKSLLVTITALLLASLFEGCQKPDESIVGRNINITKLSQTLNIVVAGSDRTITDQPIEAIPQKREDLRDMRSVVQVYDASNIGGLSIPGFGGLKLGKDEKSLSVYYIETKTVVKDKDTSVYGVGYSIHYLFKKIKKGLSVDKLPFIAASVQLDGNKTQVFYSIQSYGIRGNALVKYFKPVINKPFDVEGFGIMQSSIDGIHNVLGDSVLSKSVTFTPHLFTNIKPSEL